MAADSSVYRNSGCYAAGEPGRIRFGEDTGPVIGACVGFVHHQVVGTVVYESGYLWVCVNLFDQRYNVVGVCSAFGHIACVLYAGSVSPLEFELLVLLLGKCDRLRCSLRNDMIQWRGV